MTNKDIRQYVVENLQPMFDKFTDIVMTFYDVVANSFPENTPEDVKSQVLKQLLDIQANSLLGSIEQIVPEDLAGKIKEAMNGREL